MLQHIAVIISFLQKVKKKKTICIALIDIANKQYMCYVRKNKITKISKEANFKELNYELPYNSYEGFLRYHQGVAISSTEINVIINMCST